jgi:N-acyl-L-homoserine lactone synthetase
MESMIISHDSSYPSQTGAAALARVDALAAQAVSWIAPIRFGVAKSNAERQAAYRRRYQAVIERGWLQPQDMPDGLEQDTFDEHALQILAWDGETLVATCRIILPEAGLRFPTEEAFDLHIDPRGQVVDAGRFVVARDYSSMEHRLLASLMARSWLEVRAHGYSHVCAAFTSKGMLRVFRQMGFRYRILAPARHYWGTERVPILFDVEESAQDLVGNWQPHLSDA